jgi:hypothetical protein
MMKIENSGKKELEWSGIKLKEMNLEELEKLQGVVRIFKLTTKNSLFVSYKKRV